MKFIIVVSAFYIGKNPSREAATGISDISENNGVPTEWGSTWTLASPPSFFVGSGFLPSYAVHIVSSLIWSNSFAQSPRHGLGMLNCSPSLPLSHRPYADWHLQIGEKLVADEFGSEHACACNKEKAWEAARKNESQEFQNNSFDPYLWQVPGCTGLMVPLQPSSTTTLILRAFGFWHNRYWWSCWKSWHLSH